MNSIIHTRIISDTKDPNNTKVPTLPLFVVFSDGKAIEAGTIRGAASIVIGDEYIDCEHADVEWHMRVETARREAMKALSRNINAVVYDSRIGIIPNNYSAKKDEQDYIYDSDDARLPEKIRIENDRLFLLSLIKIGAIYVFERDDSYFLREHKKWKAIRESGGSLQRCNKCLHMQKDAEGNRVCPVYDRYINETDGWDCSGFSIMIPGFQYERIGGAYIDLSREYDIDQLMANVGQEWMLKSRK